MVRGTPSPFGARCVEAPASLTGAMRATTTVNQPKLTLANSNVITPHPSQRELGLGPGGHSHRYDDARRGLEPPPRGSWS